MIFHYEFIQCWLNVVVSLPRSRPNTVRGFFNNCNTTIQRNIRIFQHENSLILADHIHDVDIPDETILRLVLMFAQWQWLCFITLSAAQTEQETYYLSKPCCCSGDFCSSLSLLPAHTPSLSFSTAGAGLHVKPLKPAALDCQASLVTFTWDDKKPGHLIQRRQKKHKVNSGWTSWLTKLSGRSFSTANMMTANRFQYKATMTLY